ncbi:hypothetical protein [Natrononativus amylolyticus]|nr:hypothetical protein [Natrononativus amylolyticus]
MRYPDGRCTDCGERKFMTASGVLWCLNCAERSTHPQAAKTASRDARAD